MTVLKRSILSLVAVTALSSTAHAHFKLLKPTSWIMEGSSGDPQKAAPCGPEAGDGMMTNEITTVMAGETIMVEFEETIHHPGWFRISLDEDRSKFQDIKFSGAGCTYDMDTVPTMPHDNVLVDGLAKDDNLGGSNRKFMEMVKIPDKPCEKCTLQVIQVMADAIHSPPGCIYYHCADLKIVAKPGGETGAAGTAANSGSAGAAGAASGGSTGSATAGSAATAGSGGAAVTMTPAMAAAGQGGSAAASSKPATTTPSTGAAGSGTKTSAMTATGTAGKPAATTSSGSAGATSSTKTDSTAMAPAETAKTDDGGCAVSQPGSRSSLASAALLALTGVLFGARRRQRARA